MLGEAVESARALTGARYAVIVTVDEEGAPQDPVFSGHTPGEELEQLAWPGNARLFEHLRTLAGPVRVADFPGYVHALGIDSDTCDTMLGTSSLVSFLPVCPHRVAVCPRGGRREPCAPSEVAVPVPEARRAALKAARCSAPCM